jgi:uncharacterized protein
MFMRRIGLVLLLLMGSAPAHAQSVRAGVEAWSEGRHSEAAAIWRALAAKGNADAAFNLAQAYRLGRGVPLDLAEAQRWYEQAARSGHAEAQTSLGMLLFQNGNRAGALRWLSQAADKGEPRAMLLYGTALFNGDGVKMDRVRAYALVSRAAAEGLPAARTTLDEMDQLIPLAERQQGIRLAQQAHAQDRAAASPPPPAAPRPAPKAAARSGASPKPARTVPLSPAKASPPVAAEGGAFRVQLGAFRDRSAAASLYARLAPRLAGKAMTLVPSGAMTRLQVGPYPSRAAASAACAALKPQPCFPVAAR